MKLVEDRHLWALMLAIAVVVPAARGLWLELPSSGPKCISEELHNNVVVMGDYFSFYGDQDDYNGTLTPTISVKVLTSFSWSFNLFFFFNECLMYSFLMIPES